MGSIAACNAKTAAIQIVLTAFACPYVVRPAVVTCGARATALSIYIVALQGTVTGQFVTESVCSFLFGKYFVSKEILVKSRTQRTE